MVEYLYVVFFYLVNFCEEGFEVRFFKIVFECFNELGFEVFEGLVEFVKLCFVLFDVFGFVSVELIVSEVGDFGNGF